MVPAFVEVPGTSIGSPLRVWYLRRDTRLPKGRGFVVTELTGVCDKDNVYCKFGIPQCKYYNPTDFFFLFLFSFDFFGIHPGIQRPTSLSLSARYVEPVGPNGRVVDTGGTDDPLK